MFTVKQARQLKGLTQKEIATKLGIHLDTYRRIEKYPNKATIEMAEKISQATCLAIDDIFFGVQSTLSRNANAS